METYKKYLNEAKSNYMHMIDALFKVSHGFLDDLKTMVDNGNKDGAIKLAGVIQKKVIPDLLKAIKAMNKGE
jgi:hypothetical protein